MNFRITDCTKNLRELFRRFQITLVGGREKDCDEGDARAKGNGNTHFHMPARTAPHHTNTPLVTEFTTIKRFYRQM